LSSSRIRENAEQAFNGNVDQGQSGQEYVERAWQVCISRGLTDLQGLAERIEPRTQLDAVKLPTHGKAELERLVQHALHRFKVSLDFGFGGCTSRGLGLAALFHGESGTGKTMAAEAVAAALGLPLLRADMASLLSKYYGETEKNIRRLFDIASAGGAVCLFDECDSIGSRRVDASDSRDQFLNVQINYLLTRMDSFTGVAILATNMKQSLDPAFLRRTRYVIEFPFPGTSERKAIWQSVFPSATPLGPLDFDRLSRFTLSGANIRNVALAAAHTAAANGAPQRCAVEMPHILESIRAELIKIGRPGASSEFQWTLDPAESSQEEAA
jgi:SpoVK/Ycf46/Vps4 family AAA+-type ATPase